MDLFDRQILAVPKDGKSKTFQQILQAVGFSLNTLRLHMTSLERQGMIVEAKNPKNGPRKAGFHVLPSPRGQTPSCFDPHRTVHHYRQPNLPEAKAHLQVREGRILQEHAEKVRSPKLSPNQKRRINTILNLVLKAVYSRMVSA